MGIWDKAKVLGGARMDVEYEAGSPFILYAMANAGELPADVGVADAAHPATKTVLLTQEAMSDGTGGWVGVPDTVKVVGTLAGPIAEMSAAADASEDFPVVVAWQSVPTKQREKATVLDYLGPYEGASLDASEIPPEWGQYT